jgi:hypothetical protein
LDHTGIAIPFGYRIGNRKEVRAKVVRKYIAGLLFDLGQRKEDLRIGVEG